jgi:hypothetical protein
MSEPGGGEQHSAWHPRAVLAVACFAGVVGLIIGLVASGGGGGDSERVGGGAIAGSRTTTVAVTPAAPISIELRTKKLVWVCLLNQRSRPLINGLNLLANQTVGPYDGKDFEVSFGNGSIDLTVNGKPVNVPPIAAPLGYRITPDGATRLPASEQPSCT